MYEQIEIDDRSALEVEYDNIWYSINYAEYRRKITHGEKEDFYSRVDKAFKTNDEDELKAVLSEIDELNVDLD